MGSAHDHVVMGSCKDQEGFRLISRVGDLLAEGILEKLPLVTSNHARLTVNGRHGWNGRDAQ